MTVSAMLSINSLAFSTKSLSLLIRPLNESIAERTRSRISSSIARIPKGFLRNSQSAKPAIDAVRKEFHIELIFLGLATDNPIAVYGDRLNSSKKLATSYLVKRVVVILLFRFGKSSG